MKQLTRIAFLLALPALFACSPTTAQQPAAVAFVGVNVIPMDAERVLLDQTVVVEGDRITAVGPAAEVEVPAGALRVDGAGRYLMPGLAEMHGHIPPPSAPADFIESVLFLYVAGGITTVRGMLGHDGQLDLRARALRGDLVSPTLYLAGPSFNGNSISSPEQAEAMVRAQKAEGWDLLKVHPGLTRDEYDAMARTAREVGIRFGGHVPADVGLLHAIEMGQETFDHIDGYVEHLGGAEGPVGDEALADVVRRTREAGAWVVPTMALWEVLYGTADLAALQAYDELKYMPKEQVDQWISLHRQRLASPDRDAQAAQHVIDNRMRLLKALSDGDALILMGTDAPQQFSVPGFSLHRELQRMAAAGMTPYEILRTGTYNVGLYFEDTDAFGTVAPGRRADLVLLAANPLDDVAHVERPLGVMTRGRWLGREAIDARLAEIAARYE